MSKSATYAKNAKHLIPGPREENWRYADLSLIRGGELAIAEEGPAIHKPKSISKWPRLVIGNGKVVEKPENLKGLEIIFGAVENKKSATAPANHPLERINNDLAAAGVQITISKGQNLAGLEIIFVEDGPKEGARHLKNMIVLEEDAKANILLRILGQRGASWINTATTVSIGKNAGLFLVTDFEAVQKTLISSLMKAQVYKGGSLDIFGFGIGLPSLRNEIEVALKGKGARTNLKGGLLAAEGEVIDFVTRIFHTSPGANSDQTFRAVSGRKGQTAYQGRVVVEKGAQKTEAHQSCQNLILERSGEANVKPELLIFADDVICSHGATVGELDQAALFYMMQRGIPEGEAKALLVRAFLGEIIEGLSDEKMMAHFEQKIETWMQQNLVGKKK
ncbi:MAG: SufD family Fe-S cluster assembly protein [Sphingomonadales bacterium]